MLVQAGDHTNTLLGCSEVYGIRESVEECTPNLSADAGEL